MVTNALPAKLFSTIMLLNVLIGLSEQELL